MSGGEPSSIKRDQSCAARAPVTQLYTEDLFYPHERGNVVCIRRCTASGGPRPSPTWSGRSTSPKRCSGRHAYLFTGTRGTGKTTCAKILAKAVNCEHPENGNPCNKCSSCLGIESGGFLDVMELDAASNNGVDHVRALRDEAIYSPAQVKKRVYIIDEVHMLSIAAFNALLKILEEPPEHLMFILATTELHKVPATILSRCQRFAFRRILPREIVGRLNYIAEQEGIDLRPDGAELLAHIADGALRDALSLLDQCAAAGGTIDSAAVLDALGLAGNLQTAQLMDCVLQRDTKAALLLLHRLYGSGKDVGAVLGELSALARDLLISKTAPEGGAALLTGGYDGQTMDSLLRQADSARLIAICTTLQRAAADMNVSVNRRTDAELCLLKLCDETLSGDLSAINARLARLEQQTCVMLPRKARRRWCPRRRRSPLPQRLRRSRQPWRTRLLPRGRTACPRRRTNPLTTLPRPTASRQSRSVRRARRRLPRRRPQSRRRKRPHRPVTATSGSR